MTILSTFGLGFQLLIMGIMLAFGWIEYIIPFFIWPKWWWTDNKKHKYTELCKFISRNTYFFFLKDASLDSNSSSPKMLLERLDAMWGVTEAEFHERKHVAQRQKDLGDAFRQRFALLENLEASRELRDASVNAPKLRGASWCSLLIIAQRGLPWRKKCLLRDSRYQASAFPTRNAHEHAATRT